MSGCSRASSRQMMETRRRKSAGLSFMSCRAHLQSSTAYDRCRSKVGMTPMMQLPACFASGTVVQHIKADTLLWSIHCSMTYSVESIQRCWMMQFKRWKPERLSPDCRRSPAQPDILLQSAFQQRWAALECAGC